MYANAHPCKCSCMQMLMYANVHDCKCLCALLAQAADVYAFGILLWEMCTGQKPWVGLKEQEIITKVVQNEKQPLFPRDTPAPFKVHLGFFCFVFLFLGTKLAMIACTSRLFWLKNCMRSELFLPQRAPTPCRVGLHPIMSGSEQLCYMISSHFSL